MEVALHIPEDVVESIRVVNRQNIARHILEEYAIRSYQIGVLSEAQITRLLGFKSRYELDDFLTAHQIPRNYTVKDLQEDRSTAQELGL